MIPNRAFFCGRSFETKRTLSMPFLNGTNKADCSGSDCCGGRRLSFKYISKSSSPSFWIHGKVRHSHV
jgi:hypothetical protein